MVAGRSPRGAELGCLWETYGRDILVRPRGGDDRDSVTALPLNPAQMTRVASQAEWTTGTSCSAMSLADACWCTPAVTDSSFKDQSKSRAPTKDGIPSPRFVKVSHFTLSLNDFTTKAAVSRYESGITVTHSPEGAFEHGYLPRAVLACTSSVPLAGHVPKLTPFWIAKHRDSHIGHAQ